MSVGVRTIKILVPKNPKDFAFQISGSKVIIVKKGTQLRDQLISLLTSVSTVKVEEVILSLITMNKAKDADNCIIIYDAHLFIDLLSSSDITMPSIDDNVVDDLDKYVNDHGCSFAPTPAIFDEFADVHLNVVNGKYAEELDKAIDPEILPDVQPLSMPSTDSNANSKDDFDVVDKGTEVVLRWRI